MDDDLYVRVVSAYVEKLRRGVAWRGITELEPDTAVVRRMSWFCHSSQFLGVNYGRSGVAELREFQLVMTRVSAPNEESNEESHRSFNS